MEEILLARGRGEAGLAGRAAESAAARIALIERLRWGNAGGLSSDFWAPYCSMHGLTVIEFSQLSPRRFSTTRNVLRKVPPEASDRVVR